MRSALKELEEVPKVSRLKIISKIDELAIEPRPRGVKKLESESNSYRVRVGNYRVIYQIEDFKLIVNIIKVADRKEVYRKR
ncbi:type II toxin-antitoxin system RelE/ParE family toxin [Dyadobacter sp. LHD-138]|uniref:type II toxin-antitoxin system RelE family toxin n=1 Tax=Dyadobacter sp. LHD-138 TaxID=3071413 RepID=UPI0027E0E9A3|nr:type II toxin-antitoxin system RelE/ParE family toxin [Dyadobacter sp. LHD-138]MDQ6480480.1 type II toxin-antitoxin system RelE/ParE family toxin [Dyadobacter sp. LHD-138]